MSWIADHRKELASRHRVLAKHAEHLASHHCNPGLMDASGCHAVVLCLDDNRHAIGSQSVLNAIGNQCGHRFLNLEAARKDINNPRKLADPDDPVCWDIPFEISHASGFCDLSTGFGRPPSRDGNAGPRAGAWVAHPVPSRKRRVSEPLHPA